MNASPDVRLNATFAPTFPPPGRVGFLSQSGALGLGMIEHAAALGVGLSSFVSVGNKADISGNDLIHYWETDPDTDLILLYLESFGNPRKFARISRRVGRTKPIVAVKSGRTSAGARATTSHTGALLAASDLTVDALFTQAGVIRTDTLSELFDVASVLGNQPVPKGRRVGIVTNAGGLGILCTDACEAHGLEVPSLADDVRAELGAFLPPDASTANPIDMTAAAGGGEYRRAMVTVAGTGAVDALIVLFGPPLASNSEEVAGGIAAGAGEIAGAVSIVSVSLSGPAIPTAAHAHAPTFVYPEEAARALARAVRYGEWLARPEGRVPSFPGLRHDDAVALTSSVLAEGRGWLTPEEVAVLLDCYGLPVAEWRVVGTPEEAGRAAAKLGGAVALKAISPGLVHKTEGHAVRLGLSGPRRVEAAAREMAGRVVDGGHQLQGFLVQAMVPEGVEMLIGVVHDRVFGPVVACGAGGRAVELLRDVQARITPITDEDAAEMVRSLATYPLLDGYRGAPVANVEAFRELILRVGAMVEAHPEVAEMDCNPVIVTADRAVIVDARVRVERPEPPLPLAGRRS
jgi:acyl-CoA synthetase (NDP forming)